MKKILLACIAVVAALSMNAQSYNIVGLSYDYMHMGYPNTDDSDENITTANGFGIQYIRGFGIGENPMSVEVGAKFNMVFGSKSESYTDFDAVGEFKMTNTLGRLAIPVSYAYHFKVAEGMTLTPYIGVDFRFNLMATGKYKMTYSEDGYKDIEEENINYFNKDDMNDHTYNRFQLGWHLGARLSYEHFTFSVEGGTDFIPLFKFESYKIDTSNLALTVGYKF